MNAATEEGRSRSRREKATRLRESGRFFAGEHSDPLNFEMKLDIIRC